MDTKQVIVIRKDLGMSEAKMVSQGAHASMMAVMKLMTTYNPWQDMDMFESLDVYDGKPWIEKHLKIEQDSSLEDWINSLYTKNVEYVNSEDELLNYHRQAKSEGIPCSLVEDVGKTDIHGNKIYTAIAIGPAENEIIDSIIKSLPPL